MKRLFWFGLGVAAGVLAYRKAGETARQATPAGLASNVGEAIQELAVAVGAFGADVRAGMTERERELTELTELTSVPPDVRGEPPAGRHAHGDSRTGRRP